MTDGEWVSRGGRSRTCSAIEIHDVNPCKTIFYGQELFIPRCLTTRASVSKFAFRRFIRSRHDPAGDLSHMFAGIRKLTLQKLRLNLHGLLEIGCVNQFSRMIERSFHVLFGER